MEANSIQQVGLENKPSIKRKRKKGYKQPWVLHFMVLPAAIMVFIFSYIPMSGILMAFQDYKPALGFFDSEWVGLKHFRYMWENDYFLQITWNTLFFACSKIVLNLIIPFIFALLLNEVRNMGLKRSIQTLVYLPHFLSWVTLSGILIDILAQTGIVNQFISSVFGIKPIFF